MYTQNEIIKKVNKEFIGYLMLSNEKHSLSPDTNIMQDLTLDSLDHVELVMAIEEEFDIKISDEESELCATMSDVYKLVADKLGVEYTYDVSNKQPKEKNMTTLKREDLLNTKWDVSGWTHKMKARWQQKMFEYGFNWTFCDGISHLDANGFYVEPNGVLTHSDFFCAKLAGMDRRIYTDIFPQDKVQQVATVSGSGVHVEHGSVNDTRKNVPDNTSELDSLRNLCQEHGLYMTFAPHGEVIVTEAGSDVEYEVNSEDELEKLLSALEVLNSYVK